MIPHLQAGDSIYICSPAKKAEPSTISFAQQLIKDQGYLPIVSENATGHHFYFSGTLEERLQDLQTGLDHPTAKAIFCARGGYGIIQQLNLLNWDKFLDRPKWIVGFSDVTNLFCEVGRFSLPSIHATMALNYQENTSPSLQTLWQSLKGEAYRIEAPSSEHNIVGTATGEVIGGNLSILYSLLSRTNPSYYEGKILLLEDVGESLYHFDRMIYALEFSGIFSKIKGMVIGGFTDIKDDASVFGQRIEQILLRPVLSKNIPVGFNFPVGHQNDNQAVKMGVAATLKVDKKGSFLAFDHPNT